MPSGPEFEVLIWVAIVVLGGIGELLTGSFLLLPFAIGAAVAALAAVAGVKLPWAVAVFLVVSLASLFWLRGFARRSEVTTPKIQAGAHRYVDSVGRVTEKIDPPGEGRVRLDGQIWRAQSAGGESIEVGTEVIVVEVRGTALVVQGRWTQ